MQLELYRFWWAFVVRNFIDRIIPFFLLVAMNFYIICALKREQHRQSIVIGGFSDERDDGNVFNAKTSLRVCKVACLTEPRNTIMQPRMRRLYQANCQMEIERQHFL
jgi:hypothetical protein